MSVLVAGSLHLDVVLTAPHLPAVDETVTGSGVDYVFGGKGGNQALAAARMGADVHFAGRAGSDRFGDMIRDTLDQSGMNLTQLQQDPGPSGMSAAIVNGDGDYGAVIVSAANLNIDAEAISIPDQVSLVLLQNEIPEEVNLVIARKAKAAGATVWLNAAPARTLPPALVAQVDVLIVNRVEAGFYGTDLSGLEVLTTLGVDGVSFRGQSHPGYRVEAVSSHGAGDMFVGALASRVAAGAAMEDAIDFAQAAAALHVASDLNARAHLNADAVLAFLRDQASR